MGGCSNARAPIRLGRERIEPLVDVGPGQRRGEIAIPNRHPGAANIGLGAVRVCGDRPIEKRRSLSMRAAKRCRTYPHRAKT